MPVAPEYTVINPKPKLDDVFHSLRKSDYFQIFGITSASWAYGYFFGRPVRMPTANTAATIGFTFATFLVTQNCQQRFMGYQENASEVKKFGAYQKDQEDPRKMAIPANGKIEWTAYNK
mmetsp:Transcript_51102/g.75861  ORF Transcript_51102/g.75861 Transcript_51102/m.75861 type:complete len:119 (+) Transcript_51102:124-480(+)|eukprot:CAMPEP_0195527852 /NCGR_PEP_ID=MMETSP0794_2-20130614/29760_1 /TAXON_ID=515487 /ORGANISM="Stephanopyxis turris, Strain CCMP 815" /LENGTH=118 /DNA_ID=CAMNT_0040658859 /DNA_START=111 /DNA_END=467 /DNA_ORIENTATION=-